MYSLDRQFYKRFEREARAMSSLKHPNCVSVIDYGFEAAPYIVMDFADGMLLCDLLDQGPMAPRRVVALGRQLLSALAHAHSQGIIHRDVKPGNIIISQNPGMGDHLMIFDFGLAKLVCTEQSGDLTSMAQILGTPSYMSPEQTKASSVDFRSDLYSAGVVLFEMLTGLKPFRNTNPVEVVRMQRQETPPRLTQLAPNQSFSKELEALVAHALEKAPEARFQSAEDFMTALAALPESAGSGGTEVLGKEAAASLSQACQEPIDDGHPSEKKGDSSAHEVKNPSGAQSASAIEEGVTVSRKKSKKEKVAQAKPEVVVDPNRTRRSKRLGKEKSSPLPFMPKERFEIPAWLYRLPSWVYVALGGAMLIVSVVVVAIFAQGEPQDQPFSKKAPGSISPPPAVTSAAQESASLYDEELLGRSANSSTKNSALPVLPERVNNLEDVRTLVRYNKYKEAAQGINRLRQIDPWNAYFPFLQGALYFQMDNFAQGLDHYKQALELDPVYAKRKVLNVDLIRALGNERTFRKARDIILSSVGANALPFLSEAAKQDANLLIRQRAGEVARQLGK
jgi:serine/threonine-protein kinase